ncbi:hypothetical protein [Xanthocytophaga flava]|uniref:hypothetical protein n=1 Tax=Xanthocytophaga flava TaxID=3048013 RepID=UPI0028D7E301|nr:hypothetical protein [Xanthocytophaga flavus]
MLHSYTNQQSQGLTQKADLNDGGRYRLCSNVKIFRLTQFNNKGCSSFFFPT